MDIDSAFPSKFLKSDDLEGKALHLKISHVEMQEVGFDDDKDLKPILYFHDRKQGLDLNKTNAADLSVEYGSETDEWVDKSVILFSTSVRFRGKRVQGLRVRFKDNSPRSVDDEEPPPFDSDEEES